MLLHNKYLENIIGKKRILSKHYPQAVAMFLWWIRLMLIFHLSSSATLLYKLLQFLKPRTVVPLYSQSLYNSKKRVVFSQKASKDLLLKSKLTKYITQVTFTCSNSTIETGEKVVKHVYVVLVFYCEL